MSDSEVDAMCLDIGARSELAKRARSLYIIVIIVITCNESTTRGRITLGIRIYAIMPQACAHDVVGGATPWLARSNAR